MLPKFLLIIMLTLNSALLCMQDNFPQDYFFNPQREFFQTIKNLNDEDVCKALINKSEENKGDDNNCLLKLAYDYDALHNNEFDSLRPSYNHDPNYDALRFSDILNYDYVEYDFKITKHLLEHAHCDPNMNDGLSLKLAIFYYHTKYAQQYAQLLFKNGAKIIQNLQTIKSNPSAAHLSVLLQAIIFKNDTNEAFTEEQQEGMINILCTDGKADLNQLYPDYAKHWHIKSKTQPTTMDTFINQINKLSKHYPRNKYRTNFLAKLNIIALSQR